MPKPIALFFAISSVALFALISFAISINRPVLAVILGVVAICWMGLGFVTKAKHRRIHEKQNHPIHERRSS